MQKHFKTATNSQLEIVKTTYGYTRNRKFFLILKKDSG